MDYLELPPPPPLDRVVHRLWFLRTGAGTESSGVQTIVPDGRCEIVLHLGEPFAELDTAGRASPQGRALVAGQLTAPFRLASRPGADVIGIRLRTGAAHRLLAPQHELTGRVVPLADVVRGLESRLLDAVRAETDVRRRAAGLWAALARALSPRPAGAVEAAVTRLESGSSGTIGELARSVGLTPRTLQRRFRAEVGMDPTLLRRILRFRAAFRLLERLPPGRWSRVAPRVGYFDQAHLIRDFRRFAGAAPSAFFGAGPELARALSARPAGAVEAAVTRLESGRSGTIGELARSVGLTPRTLQRRFRAEVGMDPTLLRRILRFRAAFRLLERLPPGRWSRVAPRVGYFDQAHLIRDFRRFAGAAPSAFFGAGPELARAFSGGEAAE